MPLLGNAFEKRQIITPMLAATLTDESLLRVFSKHGVLLTSPKLDGIRIMAHTHSFLTRNLKQLRNNYISRILDAELKSYFRSTSVILDGELIVLNEDGSFVDFRVTDSKVMSEKQEGFHFGYFIFDYVSTEPAFQRYNNLVQMGNSLLKHPHLKIVPKIGVRNATEFMFQYEEAMRTKYEGLMAQNAWSPYMHKRSTFNEGCSLKYKQFEEEEAEIIGLQAMMTNENEAVISETGATKRSKKAEGMVVTTKLGAFKVRNARGDVFNVGTGFTDEDRETLFDDKYIGQQITYKYFPYGGNDKPRFPTFKGFRNDL
jgi:DNA ligase-1